MNLVKLQDFEFEDVYVNPDDVSAIVRCDGGRDLSYVKLKSGETIQVKGVPHQVAHLLYNGKD